MNALGLLFVWTALQVTLLCLAGATLYLICRRHGPSTGAWVLCSVLGVAIAISALSHSPWPRWWSMVPSTAKVSPPAISSQPSGAEQTIATSVAEADAAPAEIGSPVRYWQLLFELVRHEASEFNSPPTSDNWRWPAWLACSMLLGMTTGLVRLLVACGAVLLLGRRTRPIDDPAMRLLVTEQRMRLKCARPVELREPLTAGPHAPATVGWLRPVIVLPPEWRDWTEGERRAVLAHEVAHIAHHDFPLWLLAQLGVALHFYHPLVHWLADRLRLEQEVAADLRGAAAAGGAQAYLTVLAEMALRQDQTRLLWAGRPFLPTRSTLMRRIEMLHRQPYRTNTGPSRTARGTLALLLFLVGLTVAGLRGPEKAALAEAPAEQPAVEAAPVAQPPATQLDFGADYLPADTVFVASLKPLEFESGVMAPIFFQFPHMGAVMLSSQPKNAAVEVAEILVVVTKSMAAEKPQASNLVIYRTRKPYDWKTLRPRLFGENERNLTEASLDGQKYYRAVSDTNKQPVAVLLPDDQTLVMIGEQFLERVLTADRQQHPAWFDQWQATARSPIAIGGSHFDEFLQDVGDEPGAAQVAKAVAREAQLLFAAAHLKDGGIGIRVNARCKSGDGARGLVQAIQVLVGLGTQQAVKLDVSTLPEEVRAVDVVGGVKAILSGITATAKETEVDVTGHVNGEFLGKLVAATDAHQKRVTAEQKVVCNEKASRLVAALKKYHDDHGFYPASSILGPDGKTPHSWRVELLPYLGEQELFEKYKLDEPWDSETNRKLIEAPAVFRAHEGNYSNPNTCDFYLLTGPGTLFDGSGPATNDAIKDAAGETILLVEARQPIPWTKPQDIEYRAEDHMPRLGHNFGKGFFAAFADGSVQFIEPEVEESTLRALFTKAGGETVKLR